MYTDMRWSTEIRTQVLREGVSKRQILRETGIHGTTLQKVIQQDLPFTAWVEVMGTQRLTGALLDRLTHRVHILEANGPSYRLREAKRRLRKQTSSRRRKN